MTQQLGIRFHDTQGNARVFEAKAGAANKFPVPADIHVELVNLATGKAPPKVQVRRRGNDLIVRVDDAGAGGQATEITLEGYYPQIGCQLLGLNEQGQYVEYLPDGNDASKTLALLREDDAAGIALGAAPVDITVAPGACVAPYALGGGAAAGGMSPLLAGTLGALGLGAAALIVNRISRDDDEPAKPAAPATPLSGPQGYVDNTGPIQNTHSVDPLTDDSTPGLQIGALPPGATGAVLYVDGAITPATYDPATGTLTPVTPLANGPHVLGYGWSNAGGTSASSPTLTVTVDTVAPARPGNLQVADTDGDGKANISGTGEPGGKVLITDPSNGTHTATVDASGRFEIDIDMPARPTGEWIATVTDPAGNTSEPARVTVTDLSSPAAARIDRLIDDIGTIQGPVSANGVTDDNRPTLTGTAEPGATITLREGTALLGTALADASGNWSFTPATPLADGSHSITAQAADASHNSAAPSLPFVFTIDTQAPAMPLVYGLSDNVGRIQGPIVNGTVTDDATPTLTGKSDPGGTVTVRDNTTVLGTVLADASGNWSFTPPAPLADGPHALSATATTATGLPSTATAPIAFTVDTQAPATVPAITSVTDDQGSLTGPLANSAATLTDDASPVIAGTAQANTIVIIRDGGREIGTAAVSAAGTWSFTPLLPLMNGAHSITATAMDMPGNVGASSQPFDFAVLAGGVPSAPAITSVIDDVGPLENIAPGALTNDARPTVRGTAPAGLLVTLRDEASQILGTATADANGQWSITPATALADGLRTFTATITAPNGNVSEPTGGYAIRIDTQAPTTPVAPGTPGGATLTDNVGAQTGPIANNASTDDATPTFAGTAEAGSKITIHDGAAVLGTALADAAGNWSFTPAVPLAEGPHALSFTVTDPAGNVSQPSAAIAFSVDTGAARVTIDTVMDDTGARTGALAQGARTDDLRPTVTGKASPGGQVSLYREGSVLLGTTTADARGNWSITPAQDLGQGQHSLSATVTTAAAGQSAPTAAFVLVIDTQAPATPSILAAGDDVGSLQGPLANGAASDDSTPRLWGTAEAASTVTVRDGTTVLGTALADASGNWNFTPATPLNPGPHTITATATDASGNESESSTAWNVSVDTSVPTVPLTAVLTDNVGIIQGVLASNAVTDDASPTFSGAAELGSKVIVRDGTSILGTAVTDAAGAWSFTPASPLTDGPHSFTAQVIDAVGNAGPQSAPIAFSVDTQAPTTVPVVTSVTDDQGTLTGPLVNSAATVTDDANPVISGTAQANTIVTIKDGSQELGTAAVSAAGTWTFISIAPLLNGVHQITATARDEAGNTGPVSLPFAFTVVAGGVPSAPAITNVSDDVGTPENIAPGGVTNDPTLTVRGTATAGNTVTLRDGSTIVGTALADAGGQWSITTSALSEGGHVLTAIATNSAGNVSDPTGNYTVTVDLTAPAIPAALALNDNVGTITGDFTSGTTDDATPTFHGTGNPGDTVIVRIDGTPVQTVTVTAAGTWSYTPSSPLSEGAHAITAQATDRAGNPGAVSTPMAFSVDTSAVAIAIGQVSDNAGTVTGALSSGGVTDDTTPTLSGTATRGGTVRVYDGSTLVGTALVDASGNWSMSTSPLVAGTHSLSATVTTVATGESAPTAAFTLTIDLTPPPVPTITGATDDVGSVQGAIAAGLTDDTTPSLSGTAEAGSTVSIYDGATLIGTVAATAAGTWAFTPPTPLNPGSHSITVTAKDAAGTTSLPSLAYSLNVDTTAPASPTSTILTDNAGSIVGTIANNSVTDDATPTYTGSAEANARIDIYNGTLLIGSTTANAGGNWTFMPAALPDGTYTFTARATDGVGNTGADSTAITFTVDTAAPAAPSVPNLDAADDTGVSSTDNITSQTSGLTFTGTAENGSTLTLFNDANSNGVVDAGESLGSALVSGSSWSIDAALAGSATPYSIKAIATDTAGVSGPASAALLVTVDTSAPAASGTPDLDAADDTGLSSIDNITSRTTGLTFTGTAENGSTVTLFNDVNGNGAVDTGESLGSAVATGSNWSIDAALAASATPYQIKSIATNTSGITGSASGALAVTVDTAAPGASSAPDLDPGDDTGVSSSDNITSQTSGLTFTGTAENGSTVTLFNDANGNGAVDAGENLGTAVASGGNWSIDAALAASAMPYSIKAIATDLAGTSGPASAALLVTVDTSAPTAPSTPDLNPGDDTGVSSTDNVTSQASGLTFTGTAENGSAVTLFNDANSNGVVDAGESLGTAVATAGAWSIDAALAASATPYQIKSIATNTSGVTGSASGALAVTVDTAAPAAPSAPDLDPGDDTGVSSSDNITTQASGLTFTGTAENGSAVTLFNDANSNGVVDAGESLGTAVATAGAWSIDAALAASATPYSIKAIATDLAGTSGPASGALSVTVDTTAPAAPTSGTLTDNMGSTVGTIANNGVTDDTTPTYTGSAEANARIDIYNGVTLVGSTTANAGGNWTFTPAALPDGTYIFTARATDAAGTTGAGSTAITFTIDTAVPPAPSTPDLVASDDTGASSADNITSQTSALTFTGTAADGSTVTLFRDNNGNGVVDAGESLGSAVATGGNWSIDAALPHSAIAYQIKAVATSTGGTSVASAALSVIVDTSVPLAPSTPNLASVDDTGVSSVDNITNLTTGLTFTGTAQTGSTVILFDDANGNGVLEAGESLGSAVAVAGNWSIDASLASSSVPHQIKAVAMSAAGASSTVSGTLSVTVDATPPASPTLDVRDINGNGQYELYITAEPNSTVTVTPPNGIPLGPYAVGPTGIYSVEIFGQAPDGIFTATTTDDMGNTSTPTTFSYHNYIQDWSTPGFLWTVNPYTGTPAGTNGYTSAYNSSLASGHVIGGNGLGTLVILGDSNGELGNSVIARTNYTFEVVQGKAYDFEFDVVSWGPNFVPPLKANASIASWVLLNPDDTLAAILPGRYSTGGNFDDPSAAVLAQNVWLHEEVSFVSQLATGQYKLGLVWETTSTTYDSTGDMTFDRVYLGDHNGTTPAATIPPLILDLNQDGVIGYGKSLIDIDGDGVKDITSWAGKDDGVLVWDKYHDGQVHDSSQYAFSQYAAGARTDLEGLRVFDTNGDGRLDSLDAVWKEMTVWQDANNNGVSDAGELKTMAQVGVKSIGLTSDGVASRPADGVTESGRTTAVMENGSHMAVADVAFSYTATDPLHPITYLEQVQPVI